jgi:phosphatidylglycerophosphate synthase
MMLDGRAKLILDPYLVKVAGYLKEHKITPDQVTLAGFAIGLVAAICIAFGWYWAGLAFLLLSRAADGLDGTLARMTQASDFGGFLDIVLDFAFYGFIPLAFVVSDPEANAIAGAVLIFSFYVNGASFLAFSTMAEKRHLSSEARGKKSLYFTTGLAEATETILVFVLACVFPQWFPILAWMFALICFYTALSRIIEARVLFVD